MVKTEREIKEIISRYAVELEKLGIKSQRIFYRITCRREKQWDI